MEGLTRRRRNSVVCQTLEHVVGVARDVGEYQLMTSSDHSALISSVVCHNHTIDTVSVNMTIVVVIISICFYGMELWSCYTACAINRLRSCYIKCMKTFFKYSK